MNPKQVYEWFLANGESLVGNEGTLSNVFVVALKTGKIHATARGRGTAVNAAARAGLRLRKLQGGVKEELLGNG
jgi:hypothetical protein